MTSTTYRLFTSITLLCLLAVGFLATAPQASAALPDETPEQKDARMGWWREAKFGMFIHWGLYAVPAGEWNGKQVPGVGEWIMNRARIPVDEYRPLQKQFNPIKYDPKLWVDIAKRAGMKYIVITSKHHDGFCLFDSEHTEYDVMGTPYGKDLLKPLAEAAQEAGIQICWYHSVMDWQHPDAKGERFPLYADYMKSQLEELLTNYGPIGVLWFDGEWIGEWDEAQGVELEKFCRKLQPNLIVNNRVGKRKQRSPGDFGTPEQHIPPTGIPGWDWETCMTMNDTWGFKTNDHHWKSNEDLLHKLIDIVSKGGNFLLNVGPTAEGEIPPESIERLEAIGKWLAVNGQSVYGTQGSPFRKTLPWGRVTRRSGEVYLHVFDWPEDGAISLPALTNKIVGARLLADANTPLDVTLDERTIQVTRLPAEAPDPIVSVIVLEIEGDAEAVEASITQTEDGTVTLTAAEAVCHGNRLSYESGGGKDNVGFWTNPAEWVSWQFTLKEPGTYTVQITTACPDAAAGSDYVLAIADQQLPAQVPATGDWAKFTTTTLGTLTLPTTGKLTLTVKAKNLKHEGVMNLKSVVLTPVADE